MRKLSFTFFLGLVPGLLVGCRNDTAVPSEEESAPPAVQTAAPAVQTAEDHAQPKPVKTDERKPLRVTVNVGQRLIPVRDSLHGYNHVWIRGGNGVWDFDNHTPNAPVIRALRPLKPTLLRFPGGTLAHRYRWIEGIGPPGERPVGHALSHMSTFSNGYGTLEFLEVCQALDNVEPMFVTNYDQGSPEEAAAWLAFLNGGVDSDLILGVDSNGRDWKTVGHWAKQRVDCGHPDPVGVRYFEIGNEIYWKRFSDTAEAYAKSFVEHATLLKKVDPKIRVGAVGFHKPHGHGFRDSEELTGKPWNQTVLEIAGAWCDFLTVHIYRGLEPEVDDGYPDLLLSPIDAQQELHEIRALALKARGNNTPPVEIAVTEYNAMIRENEGFSPTMVTLKAALFNASLILAMAREGVEIANFHILCLYPPKDPKLASGINFATLAIQEEMMIPTPTYHTLSLLSQSLRGHLVEVSAEHRPLGNHGRLAETSVLDLAAATPREGEASVILINRSLSDPVTIHLTIEGGVLSSTVAQHVLTSSSIDDSNDGRLPEVSPVTVYPLTRPDSTVLVHLPPASLNVIELGWDPG